MQEGDEEDDKMLDEIFLSLKIYLEKWWYILIVVDLLMELEL